MNLHNPKEIVTARAIRMALHEGDTNALLLFRENVPWLHLLGSPTSRRPGTLDDLIASAGIHMSNSSSRPSRAQADSTLSVLLSWAERDKQSQVFSVHDAVDSFPHAVQGLIEKGMPKSFARFLDNGFNPREKFGSSQVSAWDLAEKSKQLLISSVIQAHQAREQVRLYLESIPSHAMAAPSMR